MESVPDYRSRLLKTCVVALGNLIYGASLGILGPTLLDLKLQANTSLYLVSFCVTMKSAGLALGALSSESDFQALWLQTKS